MSKINEDIMDTALDIKDGEIKIVCPPTYADAVKVHKKKKKDAEDVIKEVTPEEQKKETKMPKTDDLKKMHLSESLFEDYDVRRTTNRLLDLAYDGVIGWDTIAIAALRYMSEDDVAAMLRSMGDNLIPDENDLDEATNTAVGYQDKIKVIEYDDEYADEDEDLWTKVWNELDASMDPQDCHRQVKAKRGERYQNIHTTINGDIVVYAENEGKLDFAKRVSDHYGLPYEVREDKNPKTNGYYKVYLTIKFPEEKYI